MHPSSRTKNANIEFDGLGNTPTTKKIEMGQKICNILFELVGHQSSDMGPKHRPKRTIQGKGNGATEDEMDRRYQQLHTTDNYHRSDYYNYHHDNYNYSNLDRMDRRSPVATVRSRVCLQPERRPIRRRQRQRQQQQPRAKNAHGNQRTTTTHVRLLHTSSL